MTRAQLLESLTQLHIYLEEKRSSFAGLVAQARRQIVEDTRHVPADESDRRPRCAWGREPFTPNTFGRPRRFCKDEHKRLFHRRGPKSDESVG